MGVGILIGLVIGLAIGSVIGAIILRAACAAFNKIASSPLTGKAVPDPAFGQAMGISCVTIIVNWGIGFLLGLAGLAAQAPPIVIQLISLPVSFLVLTAMIASMLPTTIGKAVIVALFYMLISIVLVVIIVLILGGVFAAMMRV